ncbi:transcription factor HES-5-like [Rhinoderma darwinii]|uniref:transcription factor HES-5-like n=1 Tax=Rhinoderma darwinii TaxID=43563 RepID=UPI003F6699F7
MRRDRINSSIEQLHILLEKEFQRHQLPSKPEKADILEMTVTFLRRHMAERNVTASSQAQREGYSTCVQDSITFLSQHKQTQLQIQLLQNLPGAHTVRARTDMAEFFRYKCWCRFGAFTQRICTNICIFDR